MALAFGGGGLKLEHKTKRDASNKDLYPFFHMMVQGSKQAQLQGSQVGTIGTKKVEFILWGK